MGNGSCRDSGVTALVGLDGFVVIVQTVHDGEHWLLVETTAARAWCAVFGVRALSADRWHADGARVDEAHLALPGGALRTRVVVEAVTGPTRARQVLSTVTTRRSLPNALSTIHAVIEAQMPAIPTGWAPFRASTPRPSGTARAR